MNWGGVILICGGALLCLLAATMAANREGAFAAGLLFGFVGLMLIFISYLQKKRG
jgi:hypothetical protein